MVSSELFLVYFVLAVIYTSMLVYTIIRSANINKFISYWRNARFLYYIQLIQLFLRTLSFWLIGLIGNITDFDNFDIAFILLMIPECLTISCYIILFWIMMTANILTRFHPEIELKSSENFKKANKSLKSIQKIALYVLIVWLILDLISYIIIIFDAVQPINLIYFNSVLCFVISIIVLASTAIAQCKYSGVPYISNEAQLVMKKILVVVVVWSIGRIIHGILWIIREQNLIEESSNLSGINEQNPLPTVILIFDLLLSEILCFLFVVDYSFFQIFLNEINDYPKIPIMEPLNPLNFTQEKMNLYIEECEIVIEKELFQANHKLGVLYTGMYNEKSVVVRRLKLERVNNYIIEGLYEDMTALSNIFCPHYLNPLGLSIRGDIIDIILPYFPYGSLQSVLKSNYQRLTYMQKLKMAREIAFCLKIFHDFDKVHGHLTSHNILIDSHNSCFITDLGLDHLKKYCGLVTGYINKTSWTSPQLLNDGGNVVNKSSKSDDAYSFGIILWEILTGEEPFPHISLKQLKKMLNEGFRPGIPKPCDNNLSELLKSCWNIDPSHRPSLELIHNTLCLVIANEEGTSSFYSAED